MASSFKLTLDTTAPVFASVDLNSGLPVTGTQLVSLVATIEEELALIKGFQYKIWGDLDPEANEHFQTTEEESDWVNWPTEEDSLIKELTLLTGDGSKTVFFKVRDDVWNESATEELSVELDTTVPVITITSGPSVPKISEVATKDTATFTFKSNEAIVDWEVRVVPSEGSNHEAGSVLIPEGGGAVEAETNQEVSITGTELQTSVGGDGKYIVKVFGRNENGLWSL